MTVKITYLNRKGHGVVELSEEEAMQLVEAEQGKYYVVDAETRNIIRELKIEEGQELLLIPVIAGG